MKPEKEGEKAEKEEDRSRKRDIYTLATNTQTLMLVIIYRL